MLGIVIAIRNFFIALVLAWIGIEFSSPDTSPDFETDPKASVFSDFGSLIQ